MLPLQGYQTIFDENPNRDINIKKNFVLLSLISEFNLLVNFAFLMKQKKKTILSGSVVQHGFIFLLSTFYNRFAFFSVSTK